MIGPLVPEPGPLISKPEPLRKCLLNTPGQSNRAVHLACEVLSAMVVVVVCPPSQLHGLPYLFYSRNLLTDLAVSSILSREEYHLIVVRANWSLAPYGHQDCLLASITDRRTHTDRQQASFLHNVSLGFPLSLVVMFSQLIDQPFGIPLSLPHYADTAVIYKSFKPLLLPYINRNAKGKERSRYPSLGLWKKLWERKLYCKCACRMSAGFPSWVPKCRYRLTRCGPGLNLRMTRSMG